MFPNAVTMELVGLSSLESIEMGNGCFSSASSFAINGMIWWCGSMAELLQLQSIKLGDNSFCKSRLFRVYSLPSLQSIELGSNSFGLSDSFILQSLPSLQSIVLGKTAFGSCQQFVMNNLTSFVSFDLGGNRFASVTSFAMIGLVLLDVNET